MTGWSHLLEEFAERELRQLGLAMRLHDLGDGHAGTPQALDHLICRPGAAPLL